MFGQCTLDVVAISMLSPDAPARPDSSFSMVGLNEFGSGLYTSRLSPLLFRMQRPTMMQIKQQTTATTM